MQPSIIRELHNAAQELLKRDPPRELIPLHFGESNQGTPEFIIDAACQALRGGAVFYENNSGRADLKQALAEHTNRRLGTNLAPENFVVTCGGTQAIHLTMMALLSEATCAVVLTPSWPNITQAARIAGAHVVEFPLDFDHRRGAFVLNLGRLEQVVETLSGLRLIVINSPSNPTGWVITPQDMRDLHELCVTRGITLMSDEIYVRLMLARREAPTALRLSGDLRQVVVIDGFSKSHCMTGWRIGHLITNPELAVEMARMQEFVVSHAPSSAQVAAITALRDGESFIADNNQRYQRLRDYVANRLRAIPRSVVANCEGAFYTFFRLPGSDDSEQFCRDLLDDTGVILAPGKAFGEGGEGWLRLCFASDEERLQSALDRIERFCAERATGNE